jgi:hypothetical protein
MAHREVFTESLKKLPAHSRPNVLDVQPYALITAVYAAIVSPGR